MHENAQVYWLCKSRLTSKYFHINCFLSSIRRNYVYYTLLMAHAILDSNLQSNERFLKCTSANSQTASAHSLLYNRTDEKYNIYSM